MNNNNNNYNKMKERKKKKTKNNNKNVRERNKFRVVILSHCSATKQFETAHLVYYAKTEMVMQLIGAVPAQIANKWHINYDNR